MIPIHHYGKAPTTGLRGASGWKAGCDAVLSVLADRDEITGKVSGRELALAKSREYDEGAIAPFELRFVSLGTDDDGDEFGSCYVEPLLDQAPTLTAAKKAREPKRLVVFRQAFAELVLTPIRVHGDGPEVRAARVSDVKAEFDRRWPTAETEPKKRANAVRMAFQRALEDATKSEFATDCQDGVEWIWRVTKAEDGGSVVYLHAMPPAT
jgi:hypothetical protein